MSTLPPRLSPRAGSGCRRVLRRLARSPFATHLQVSVQAAFWPAVITSGLFLGLFIGVATRGQYATFHGFESLPTGGTR